jgi:hypothetical protein
LLLLLGSRPTSATCGVEEEGAAMGCGGGEEVEGAPWPAAAAGRKKWAERGIQGKYIISSYCYSSV